MELIYGTGYDLIDEVTDTWRWECMDCGTRLYAEHASDCPHVGEGRASQRFFAWRQIT